MRRRHPRTIPELRALERQLVVAALEESGGNLHAAARALDVPAASSVQSLARKHGVTVDGPRRGRPRKQAE